MTPSTQGAIFSISYGANAAYLGLPGDTQAFGPALRQAGEVYVFDTDPGRATFWHPIGVTDLFATDFFCVNTNNAVDGRNTNSHPNFSVTAPSIEFGYFSANSTGPGGSGGRYAGGIDNWSVTVHKGIHATIAIRGGEVELCWNSRYSLFYEIQFCPALDPTAPWITLTNCIPGLGRINCVYDKIRPGQPQRFYKVVGTNRIPANCVSKP